MNKTEIIHIEAETIRLSKEKIWAVLGNASESKEYVDKCIEESIIDSLQLIDLKSGFVFRDEIFLDKEQSKIHSEPIILNVKKMIFNQLLASEKIAIFVCTAGPAISDKAAILMKKGDYLTAYIYDIIGSLSVELAMDLAQEKLKVEMQNLGLGISNRFSPGYCGWKLDEQKKIFSLLPPKFCGISLNDSCHMQPQKSISGIIGIGKNITFENYSCNICDMDDCLYRNLKYKND